MGMGGTGTWADDAFDDGVLDGVLDGGRGDREVRRSGVRPPRDPQAADAAGGVGATRAGGARGGSGSPRDGRRPAAAAPAGGPGGPAGPAGPGVLRGATVQSARAIAAREPRVGRDGQSARGPQQARGSAGQAGHAGHAPSAAARVPGPAQPVEGVEDGVRAGLRSGGALRVGARFGRPARPAGGPSGGPGPRNGPGGGRGGSGNPGQGGAMRAPTRLTAVGVAVVMTASCLLFAALDSWIFSGPGILFGLAFVLTCFQVAIRVRPMDLAAAPISGPIAFAVALALCGQHAQGGIGGHLLGLVTDLAIQAVWLFVGTGIAVLITTARHLSLNRARRLRENPR